MSVDLLPTPALSSPQLLRVSGTWLGLPAQTGLYRLQPSSTWFIVTRDQGPRIPPLPTPWAICGAGVGVGKAARVCAK